jgi:triphosphoribosyl-dephospho-CoA synthase
MGLLMLTKLMTFPAAGAMHAVDEDCQWIRNAAVRSLYDELCLYPKPGLVSRIDTGSHSDMTAALFMKSLFSLRHYFSSMYMAGRRHAPFAQLQQLGLAAEVRMLRATAGVNTHRGAIFNLGVLCAAVGKWDAGGRCASLQRLMQESWAGDIKAADSRAEGDSNGARACRTYAVGGARGEAAAGFPHVFAVGLPALRGARRRGAGKAQATVQAMFAIMASLEDTNLLHRAGARGLRDARAAAAGFLADGGVLRSDWMTSAVGIHRRFVAERLSPGGTADLLAATLFIDDVLKRSL